MNKRHALLGLILFVSVTTITMVLISQDMVSLRAKTLRLFNYQAGETSPSSGVNVSTLILVTSKNITPALLKLSAVRIASEIVTNATKTNNASQNEPGFQKPATPTNRPLLCASCFHSDFANVTAVPEVCAGKDIQPEMLIMITTTQDGLDSRQAIRETWASVTKNNMAGIRHVFLLGTDREGKVSHGLLSEATYYKDMLVLDFVDAYGNLTFKTLAGLHYLVQRCQAAKYFLKTDQDMYIFPERILNLARQHHNTLQTSLGGSCHQSSMPWRDPSTKYYASIRSYPQSTYPGFCSGTGYIGSQALASRIVQASPNIPFFHLEDVYLALVIRHLGYNLTMYEGFLEGADECWGSKASMIMTIHEVSAEVIRSLWAKNCGA